MSKFLHKSIHRTQIFSIVVIFIVLALTVSVLQLPQLIKQFVSTNTSALASSQVVWPAFDGGGSRPGIFAAESVFNTSNVNTLAQTWQKALPYKTNGSAVYASSINTPSGTKDLIFFTTQQGSLIALDAATGNQVWRADTTGQFVASQGTSSSPAIDPSNQFVYSYGLDGKIHKYAIGTGTEDTTLGFP